MKCFDIVFLPTPRIFMALKF